jgi:hypothetical protein
MINLQDVLDRHNIRHKDLAFMAGYTIRAVGQWKAGERPVPRSVQLLLKAIDDGRINEQWLADNLRAYL